jgi:CelD/BcsL family acetyltransferase involved in cellulose biosynthesis
LEGATEYATRVVQVDQELPDAMEEFLSLMRTSRVDKQEFLTRDRERFFKDIGQALAQTGHLRLYFLQINGTHVAGALCFDYGGRRLLYNSGYNLSYSSLSVGLLLKALCLKDAISTGMSYFDFLRGPEPYKYDLGGRDVRLYHLVITRHPGVSPR